MVEIVLSSNERESLRRWARQHSRAQSLALRCRTIKRIGFGFYGSITTGHGCCFTPENPTGRPSQKPSHPHETLRAK